MSDNIDETEQSSVTSNSQDCSNGNEEQRLDGSGTKGPNYGSDNSRSTNDFDEFMLGHPEMYPPSDLDVQLNNHGRDAHQEPASGQSQSYPGYCRLEDVSPERYTGAGAFTNSNHYSPEMENEFGNGFSSPEPLSNFTFLPHDPETYAPPNHFEDLFALEQYGGTEGPVHYVDDQPDDFPSDSADQVQFGNTNHASSDERGKASDVVPPPPQHQDMSEAVEGILQNDLDPDAASTANNFNTSGPTPTVGLVPNTPADPIHASNVPASAGSIAGNTAQSQNVAGAVAGDDVANDAVMNDVANDAVMNDVANDAVMNDVANDAVMNDVANEAVTNDAVTNDAVTNDAVANDAVANDAVANDAVANDAVANEAVANDDVANDAVANEAAEGDAVEDHENENTNGEGELAPGKKKEKPVYPKEDIPLVEHILNPLAHGMPIDTAFSSFEEASAWRPHTFRAPAPDPTIPTTIEQKKSIVVALSNALRSKGHNEDSESTLNQFFQSIDDDRRIEVTSWNILELLIRRSRDGRLIQSAENAKADRRTGPGQMSFSGRLERVIHALYRRKTICKHVTSHDWTASFVDNPDREEKRVKANQKLNKQKSCYVFVGKRVLKGTPANTQEDNTEKTAVATAVQANTAQANAAQATITPAQVSVPPAALATPARNQTSQPAARSQTQRQQQPRARSSPKKGAATSAISPDHPAVSPLAGQKPKSTRTKKASTSTSTTATATATPTTTQASRANVGSTNPVQRVARPQYLPDPDLTAGARRRAAQPSATRYGRGYETAAHYPNRRSSTLRSNPFPPQAIQAQLDAPVFSPMVNHFVQQPTQQNRGMARTVPPRPNRAQVMQQGFAMDDASSYPQRNPCFSQNFQPVPGESEIGEDFSGTDVVSGEQVGMTFSEQTIQDQDYMTGPVVEDMPHNYSMPGVAMRSQINAAPVQNMPRQGYPMAGAVPRHQLNLPAQQSLNRASQMPSNLFHPQMNQNCTMARTVSRQSNQSVSQDQDWASHPQSSQFYQQNNPMTMNNGMNHAMNNGMNYAMNNGMNYAMNNGMNNGMNNAMNYAMNNGMNNGMNYAMNNGMNYAMNNGMNNGMNHAMNNGMNYAMNNMNYPVNVNNPMDMNYPVDMNNPVIGHVAYQQPTNQAFIGYGPNPGHKRSQNGSAEGAMPPPPKKARH